MPSTTVERLPAAWQARLARAVAVGLALALAALSAAVAPDTAEADAVRADGVWDPAPVPGGLISAGEHEVGATVVGQLATGTAAVLAVDGTEVARLDSAGGGRLETTTALTTGRREVSVTATLADGREVERSWTVDVGGPAPVRLSGPDRVATALAIAVAAREGRADPSSAVLARADAFADALSGAPLATHLDAPLLLTDRDQLPPAVAEHLADVLPSGAEVVLLGGEAAIGGDVERALVQRGLVPRRLAGPDRFATAARVAEELPASDRAFVASGRSFPDALAASVPAARDGHPILLAEAEVLPPATRAALVDRDPRDTVVVGGTAVVGVDVAGAVRDALGREPRRASGPDRYATAVAVAEAFFGPTLADDLGPDRPTPPPPDTVALANGLRFPDALSGAQHAVAVGAPLLLTPPDGLAPATGDMLGVLSPSRLVAYGGSGALADRVLADGAAAIQRSPDAARLVASDPPRGAAVSELSALDLRFDRPVDVEGTTVHVTLGGAEVAGTVEGVGGVPTALRFVVAADDPARTAATDERGLALEVSVRTSAADGGAGHDSADLTYRSTRGPWATVGDVTVHLPSRGTEVVGLHQSTNDGALAQVPVDPPPVANLTMPSRGRDTDRRGAADIVADPALPVLAPATGVVKRAGSYVLYCRHRDHFLVIAPDDEPEWEVKLLHFEGLAVRPGDRVTAGETVVGSAPRLFPFRSQVDRFSGAANWPHVHLEVVDPSIPDRPSPGGGC